MDRIEYREGKIFCNGSRSKAKAGKPRKAVANIMWREKYRPP